MNPEGPTLPMGWDGWMDGMDWTGYQKCPSIFSYCVRLYNMYICTYRDNKKFSPAFLWVSKFDVKFGVGEHHFEITLCTWVFKYLVPKDVFLFIFNWVQSFFWKSKKTFFAIKNWVLKFAFEKNVHGVVLEIILALTNFIKDLMKNFTQGFTKVFT